MVNRRVVGYLVNLLMFVYLTLGMVMVLSSNVYLGLLYGAIIAASFLSIAYAWCSKCVCRFHGCTHLWLGKLAQLLPLREPGRYTAGDWAGMGLYLAGLHLFPLYWLWQNKIALMLFGGLALATFLVGSMYACGICKNGHCPMNRNANLAG